MNISEAIFLVIVLPIWLYSLILMLSSVEILRIGFQSKSWLTTQVLVRNHQVNRYISSGVHTSRTYYSYVLICTYTVDEFEYPFVGFWKGGFANQVEAELEVAQLYPIDSTFNVFYNPKKHSETVVLKGFDEERRGNFISSSLFGLMLFSFMTTLLGLSSIFQHVFNVSATDAWRVIRIFPVLGLGTFFITFCCLYLTSWQKS